MIGSYTVGAYIIDVKVKKFPAPLEVDRVLYLTAFKQVMCRRFRVFPAPREVDRELYRTIFDRSRYRLKVSGPSRGSEVAIQEV